MDIKIKSSRLKNLLSYDWLKIVLSIVAGVVVWSLLFTTLGTRATVGEQFVFNVYGNVYTRESTRNNDILNDLKTKGYFSYDVLSLSAETVSGAGQYSASYMLSLKMSTQEGDVMIISDGRAGEMKEDEDPTKDIKTVINAGYIYDMDKLLRDAGEYCDRFVSIDENGKALLKEDVIEEYFLNTRMKSAGNYRKTFRTEAQRQEGVALEKQRISILYENYTYVFQAIEKAKAEDNDILWYGELYNYDENGEIVEGSGESHPFGIDLYKLNQSLDLEDETAPRVKDTWYTYADGKTTDEGLVACVFNFRAHQPDLQYEVFAFLRYLIETYSEY